MHQVRYREGAAPLSQHHPLPICLQVHQPGSFLSPVLDCYGDVITWTELMRSLTMGDCFNHKPLSPHTCSKVIITSLFFNGHTHGLWRFPGQGWNQSCSCDLWWHKARSFNPLHQARDWTHTSTGTPATAVRFLTQGTTAGTPRKS